jgi:hypothetical protein
MNIIEYLNYQNQLFIDFYEENKDWCYLTTFEKMFDRNNIQNIFTFIGYEQYYDEYKIDEILNKKIKYNLVG